MLFTVNFSTSHRHFKKHEYLVKRTFLQKQIDFLLTLVNESHSDAFENIMKETMKELEDLREVQMRGHMVRARAKWVECGEKPTKYFCNLEKRNYVNKNITKLILPNNQTISEQNVLLQTITEFYKTLYF